MKRVTGNERACPLCGNVFITYDEEWAYKKGNTYYCSWHCFRTVPEKQRGRKSLKKDQIFKLFREGKTQAEVAEILGCKESAVRYWADRYRVEEG